MQVHHRQAPASTECCRSRRQRHAEVRPPTRPSPARRAALAGRSSAGAVQAVCNGPPMSAAQTTTVHDGLLRPHLRHCSSAASAVRRLPSVVRTATPAFHVRSSGLFCSRPGGLELVISDYLRDPSRSFHHLTVFAGTRQLLFSRSTSVGLHSALEALRLCTIYTKCIPILLYGSAASPLLKS